MWFDIAITVSCAGGGLVCGWILHAFSGMDHQRWDDEPESNRSTLTFEEVSQAADQIRAFADGMVADVDAHQSRVEAVNNSLIQTAPDTSADEVAAAVSQLIASNEAMQAQLQLARDQIEQQTMQLESADRRAETDALTQVPNRRAFDKHLSVRYEIGAGEAGTLALLDVDHFKKFNDVYGHRAGDEVLKVVANVLHTHLHSYGLVTRFGGEEFAVILDGMPIEQGRSLVERARAAIGKRVIDFEGQQLQVAASAGVAELMDDETTQGWLQRADEGLYRSKEEGRDCGHWMDGSEPRRIESTSESNVPGDAEASNSEEIAGDPDAAGDGKSSVFASLPDSSSLQQAFAEIRSRTQESVTMHLLAVACAPGLGDSAMRSLLQVVRAPLRSVDRMGAMDDSTLLICMPSVDEKTAQDLGAQICRSVESIGIAIDGQEGSPVTIGIAEATPTEDFQKVVSRAIEIAFEKQPEPVPV